MLLKFNRETVVIACLEILKVYRGKQGTYVLRDRRQVKNSGFQGKLIFTEMFINESPRKFKNRFNNFLKTF